MGKKTNIKDRWPKADEDMLCRHEVHVQFPYYEELLKAKAKELLISPKELMERYIQQGLDQTKQGGT